MATNTYVALDKVTVGTATPSITFSSVPSTYTDLIVVASFTVASDSANLVMTFNGDTTSGLYSKTQFEGTGTSALSGRTAGANSIGLDSNIGDGTTGPSIHILHLMNYANTSVFKTVLHRQSGYNSTYPGTAARVGLWRNTNAITSVTLNNGGTNFAVGSTFSLYGVAAEAISPTPKATGGTIYSDSTYYYHVFGSTGTFTPLSSLTADILVIAGGGGAGGGTRDGGGGGAGGLLAFTSQSLSATGYTCTVGGGGTGGTDNRGTSNGGNSQFGGLTAAAGGGYGGGYSGGSFGPNTGGSGGGGQHEQGGASVSPSGQGYAGGNGNSVYTYGFFGGGGGGAGAVGANATNTVSGAGGNGSSSYSNWVIATGVGQVISGTGYIAGGGGGGYQGGSAVTGAAGGYGGGGRGNTLTNFAGVAGTANTGGGGGGGGWASASGPGVGGNGGSGVVIVRYAKA